MPRSSLNILYEDNHLLAINKPAGLATMGVPSSQTSLLDLAREYVKRKHHKPGNVYLGVVSRLDALVTGVVLLARTSKAASRLSLQFRQREVKKIYWALVGDSVSPETGEMIDWLCKRESLQRMVVSTPSSKDSVEARLTYRVMGRHGRGSWLEIELLTGRKHQIRVQLSSRGYPLLGDRKYGSSHAFSRGIALHARQLEFIHPVRREPVCLVAEPPNYWPPASFS